MQTGGGDGRRRVRRREVAVCAQEREERVWVLGAGGVGREPGRAADAVDVSVRLRTDEMRQTHRPPNVPRRFCAVTRLRTRQSRPVGASPELDEDAMKFKGGSEDGESATRKHVPFSMNTFSSIVYPTTRVHVS